tara:strand:+ start:4211 stop:4741 length:531 start_codon:yes stop_codon:yes gene_type:complete
LKYKLIKKYLFIKNLSNAITIFRIFLVIPLIILLEIKKLSIVWILIIIGGISDYLDGYFARLLNIKTKYGALIDPLADKIFILIPFIWLCKFSIIPYWSLSILLIREFIISTLRSLQKDGLPAVSIAKYKALFQFLSLFLLFMPISSEIFKLFGLISYWLGFILSIYSFYYYLRIK